MPTTARLALPYPALTSAADVPADMAALAAALDAVVDYRQTTAATRPANPGHQAVVHWSTDTHKLSFWDGTAWYEIGPANIGPDTVTSSEIAANAVGSSELADGAVDTAAILDGAVTGAKIADGTITAADIAAALKPSGGAGGATETLRALGATPGTAMPGDQIVPSAQIADGSITAAKVSATLKPSGSAAAGTEALRALGTSAGTAAAGDDPRFLGATTINFQGGSYTLVIGDRGKMIDMSNPGAITLTVPADAVAFAVGDFVHVMQTGAGQISVVGAGGVTVYANPGPKLAGQFATATLMKRASNQWILFGGITS